MEGSRWGWTILWQHRRRRPRSAAFRCGQAANVTATPQFVPSRASDNRARWMPAASGPRSLRGTIGERPHSGAARRSGRPGNAAALGAARPARADRHQVRLRRRRLRCLHCACRRPSRAVLRDAARERRDPAHHDDRGAGQRRSAACAAARLAAAPGAAMRLLPERHSDGGCGAARGRSAAERSRHRCRDHEHLPLRHLPADPRRDSQRRRILAQRRAAPGPQRCAGRAEIRAQVRAASKPGPKP
jgi:hypothetical protein